MRVHKKTLLLFGLAMVLLCAAGLLLSTVIILRDYRALDQQTMLQRVERFHLDLQERLKPVVAAIGDLAPSDALDEFLKGQRPDFPASDLGAPVLENLGLNFITFWNPAGDYVAGQYLPGGGGKVEPMPDDFIEALRQSGLVPQMRVGESASGKIIFGNRVCLVSAHPVTRTSREGGVSGTVVGGTMLSPAGLKNLELFSGYSLNVLPLSGLPSIPGWPQISERLRAGENPVIEPLNRRELAAFSIQNDFRGHPLFIAELISPRVFYWAGWKSILWFLGAFAGIGLVLVGIVWFLLDWAVLSPLQRLGARVEAASRAGELPRNLHISGDDEIAALGRQIELLSESVSRAEADYREVVEELSELIVRYEPSGTLVFVNAAFCEFVGMSRAELIGANMVEIFPAQERSGLNRAIAGLSPAKPTFSLEQRFEGAGGRERWLSRSDRGVFDAQGNLVEVQAVIRDVTESRNAKLQLQQSEARYRSFFEAASDAIMIVDGIDERILDVNPGLCNLFGWPKEHFIGAQFWKIAPFQRLVHRSATLDHAIVWPGMRRLLAVELKQRSGRTVHVDAITVSYLSSDRQVIQWNFRDVTATKTADDALRQLSGRLLRLQDEERRRIARELHDSTGQNLTALQINMSLLEQARPGSIESRQYLADCRALADRCASEIRTISYLLHPPLLEEVGLAFAVKWFAEGLSNRSNIQIKVYISDGFPRLSPEAETSLFRVVQESMSNVHRHSGGTEATIELAQDNDQVIVEIRDNGAGMPQDMVDAVNASKSSLGVGLAGMRERLAQLGGQLAISSDSTGTCVHARMPISPWPDSAS